MPFSRPTIQELIARVLADIEGGLPEADSRLRRSVLDVLARAEAGVAHGLYGYLDFIARQVLPDSAEAEFLDRHAAIWGVARKPAAAAAGLLAATGGDGVVIPAGTLWQRSDGAEYRSDADAVVLGGSASVPVTARLAGVAGNAGPGIRLRLVSPIAGVASEAAVAGGGIGGGAEAETDAALLARLLARIQTPPHGGARHDYVAWALAVPGVTRAWCYPGEMGLGTVTVRVMTDDTTADGIPDAATLAAVQDHVAALRPVTADLYVVAPVASPLDVRIAGLDPATASVKAAVEAEVRDLVRREAEPGGTLLVSHLREAISVAAGEWDHRLVAPAADIVAATGQIVTFNGIVWI